MKVLSIALSYLKQNIRRPVLLILLVLCPVLLILILGQIFSGIFSAAFVPEAMQIGYSLPASGNADFESFAGRLGDAGITMHTVADRETGIRKTADGEFQAFILFDENGPELFANSSSNVQAGIIEGLLRNYLRQRNLYGMLSRLQTAVPDTAAARSNTDFVTRDVLSVLAQPRALDYMGIIILSMTILFGSHLAAFAVSREKILKTLDRIYAAPVRRLEFFAGIVLGVLATLLIQMTAVFLAARYMLGIQYGKNILRIAILLVSECFFSIALGTAIAALVKDSKAATGLMNSLLPVLIFLGGGYMKLPDTPVFNVLSRISPLDWINKALLGETYTGDRSYFLPAVGICLLAGILFLAAAGRKMTRSSQK